MSVSINTICRVCMCAEPEQACNIFTHRIGKRKHKVLVINMFEFCTQIKPQMDDGLPPLICKVCLRQLKLSYAFSLRCKVSQKMMLKLLTESSKLAVKVERDETANVGDEVLKIEQIEDVKPELPEIKHEIEDDDWDAEDDKILVDVVNSRNELENITEKLEIEDNEPKKRGRRRKEEKLDSEAPKIGYQCDECGKILSTKSNLTAHKVCHTDQRPYTCKDCPASFKGYSALFQHRKVHTGETPYHCEYCPKQFSRRTGLINHIRIHTGEKQFTCEICFKNFAQSAQLCVHLKRHKGEKSFLCQECGKGFPVKSDLKVHQRIHNGEKPYSCHLCTKTFATAGNLSIHVRIHKKEIRYHCKECSRGFVTCSSYNLHVKRHKGQKDYLCECGKTFYTVTALKQHRVVHTGEKKYQCKICERKFTQTGHLSRHFKKCVDLILGVKTSRRPKLENLPDVKALISPIKFEDKVFVKSEVFWKNEPDVHCDEITTRLAVSGKCRH